MVKQLLYLYEWFWKITGKGKLLKTWKTANTVPVHKKEDMNLLKNYFPISLLSIFSKFLNIFNYLLSNDERPSWTLSKLSAITRRSQDLAEVVIYLESVFLIHTQIQGFSMQSLNIFNCWKIWWILVSFLVTKLSWFFFFFFYINWQNY